MHGKLRAYIPEKASKTGQFMESVYTSGLKQSRQQFQINASATEDRTLVEKLSKYSTELTILLDPLEAQLKIIRSWQRWIDSNLIKRRGESIIFEEDIKAREDQVCSLRRLQERARESQALVSPHLCHMLYHQGY